MKPHAIVLMMALAACSKSSSLQSRVTDFFTKVADAMESSKGDCDKLGAGLESLAPDAKQLVTDLRHAGKDLEGFTLSPGLVARLNSDPTLLDRCDKPGTPAGKALDDTLFPLMMSKELVDAMADALGKAGATK